MSNKNLANRQKKFNFLNAAGTMLLILGALVFIGGVITLFGGIAKFSGKNAVDKTAGIGLIIYSFGAIISGVFTAASGELMKVFVYIGENTYETRRLLEKLDRKGISASSQGEDLLE